MRIAFEGLGRRFGSGRGAVDAVRDVTLEVEDGELFVLLGPSGCGKSTLLELCAGLQRPTSGAIRFGERVVTDASRKLCLPPKGRDVAMVFQSYALYPHMSVFENIAFPLRVAREERRRIEEAVRETAATLGISALLERRPGALSGGQRQRVAIARAIVRRPAVFLLDEPLSNLDAQLRASTRAELKRLQRRLGATTLHVTHDQVEAMTLGDRIALLRDGALVQVGSPEELYERPRTAFAATFLGSPPMNVLPVRLERAGRELRARAGGVPLPLPRADRVHAEGAGEALLGIRPERLRIESGAATGAGAGDAGGFLAGTVAALEPRGRERLCRIAVPAFGGRTVAALTSDRTLAEGTSVRLCFDAADLHVFPAEGGGRMGEGAGEGAGDGQDRAPS